MATWGELAKIIGISRAMLDFLRNGSKAAGPKVLRRIVDAERAAGLLPPATVLSVVKSESPVVRETAGAHGYASGKGQVPARAELEALRADLKRLLERVEKMLGK
jgi:hypothetical protein